MEKNVETIVAYMKSIYEQKNFQMLKKDFQLPTLKEISNSMGIEENQWALREKYLPELIQNDSELALRLAPFERAVIEQIYSESKKAKENYLYSLVLEKPYIEPEYLLDSYELPRNLFSVEEIQKIHWRVSKAITEGELFEQIYTKEVLEEYIRAIFELENRVQEGLQRQAEQELLKAKEESEQASWREKLNYASFEPENFEQVCRKMNADKNTIQKLKKYIAALEAKINTFLYRYDESAKRFLQELHILHPYNLQFFEKAEMQNWAVSKEKEIITQALQGIREERVDAKVKFREGTNYFGRGLLKQISQDLKKIQKFHLAKQNPLLLATDKNLKELKDAILQNELFAYFFDEKRQSAWWHLVRDIETSSEEIILDDDKLKQMALDNDVSLMQWQAQQEMRELHWKRANDENLPIQQCWQEVNKALAISPYNKEYLEKAIEVGFRAISKLGGKKIAPELIKLSDRYWLLQPANFTEKLNQLFMNLLHDFFSTKEVNFGSTILAKAIPWLSFGGFFACLIYLMSKYDSALVSFFVSFAMLFLPGLIFGFLNICKPKLRWGKMGVLATLHPK